MNRTIAAAVVALFVTVTAFAHAGHVHNFLGTVKSLHGDQLVIVTTASQEASFVLTPATAYSRGAKSATRADVQPGTRVAVHVADDGHTVTTIRLGAHE